MRSDVLIGLALIAMFGGYYAMADALPSSLMDTSVTSADTPRMIAIAGLGLSFLLILQAAFAFYLQKKTSASSSEEIAPEDDGTIKGQHLRACAMLVFGGGYVLLLPYLGYALSLALLFAAVAAFRAGAMSWRIAAFAVIAAVAFQLIFAELLNVRVPPGILAPILG